jgi:hypothetical protein
VVHRAPAVLRSVLAHGGDGPHPQHSTDLAPARLSRRPSLSPGREAAMLRHRPVLRRPVVQQQPGAPAADPADDVESGTAGGPGDPELCQQPEVAGDPGAAVAEGLGERGRPPVPGVDPKTKIRSTPKKRRAALKQLGESLT